MDSIVSSKIKTLIKVFFLTIFSCYIAAPLFANLENEKDFIFVNQGKFVISSEILGILSAPIVNLISLFSKYKSLIN